MASSKFIQDDVNHPHHDPHFRDSRPEAHMITASQLTGASPAGEYSWRPPSPPSILVPQTNESQELTLPQYNGFGHDEEENEILRTITSINRTIVGAKDWKYEWRRQAQSILTFLYLGPSSATRDLEFLRTEGITLLLVIRSTMTAQASLLSGEKVARQLGIEAAALDVGNHSELIAGFPRAVKIINDHLVATFRASRQVNPHSPSHGKVLIFCESGNERSAAVVVAYLMTMYAMDMIKAVQYVQSQRFCVAYDDELKRLLSTYQDILVAQRTVAQIPRQVSAVTKPTKRIRSAVEEDEGGDSGMDLDGKDDEERFSGRSKFVPFMDSGSGGSGPRFS